MLLALSWTLKYGLLFNLNRDKIIIFPFKIEFLVVDLPSSCPTLAANNRKKSIQLGLINQINVFVNLLILIYCQQIVPFSIVVWLSCLVSKLFQKVMNRYCTKHIPVSHVSLRKLAPGISPCRLINTLVHTKDILRVSVCHNVSIMTCVIKFQRSVTPVSLMSNVP